VHEIYGQPRLFALSALKGQFGRFGGVLDTFPVAW